MLTLAYKDVAYDLNIVCSLSPDAGFFHTNPLGKIPAYQDERITLSDSTVICEYLNERYPMPELLPFGAAQRARTRWLEEYADSVLADVCSHQITHQKLIKPLLTGQDPDLDTIEKAVTEQLPLLLDYLEIQIANKQYFVAETLSMADLSISSQLMCLRAVGIVVDISRWPRIGRYMSRLCSGTIYKNQIDSEDQYLQQQLKQQGAA